jgi:hypothetical protein
MFKLAIVAFAVVLLPLATVHADTNAGMGDAGGTPSQWLPNGRGEVLVYMNYLDSGTEAANVIAILEASGKTVVQTLTTDPTTLATELVDKMAFVVPELYDDSWPTADQLAEITATFSGFAPALLSYVQGGGNVIVCEGDASCAAGEAVVNAIGMASIVWVDETFGQVPTVLLWDDPLMDGITTFNGINGDGSYVDNWGNLYQVIVDPTMDIIVSRAVFECGNFVIIGYDYYNYNAGEQDRLLVNAVGLIVPCPVESASWSEIKAYYR